MSDFDGLMESSPRRDRLAEQMRVAEEKKQIRQAGMGRTLIPEAEFQMPVSQNFLAHVLRMDPATVKQRLRDGGLKPAGEVGAGRPVFWFHEALPYLIKPKMDVGTYIKTLNPTDLPNSINKVFWEAERTKNKVFLETGEAWPTERVLETLGTLFMMIKDRIPLLKEGMRDAGLNDEQNRQLEGFCDQFQRDLHETLVDLPKQRNTYSRREDIDTGEGEFA